MAYCAYSDVNLLTNLTNSDVANVDVTNIIAEATKELNSLINVHIERESIDYIDNTRKNDINGVNKTFYIKNWKERFIADMNNDGSITASDIVVYKVDNDGTESAMAVASVDASLGKFVLTNAPAPGSLYYVSYDYCLKNPATPDPLIKLACTLLSSAYCYAKINIGMAPQVAFGNTRIYRHIDSFDLYYKRFLKIINQINNKMSDYRESEVKI